MQIVIFLINANHPTDKTQRLPDILALRLPFMCHCAARVVIYYFTQIWPIPPISFFSDTELVEGARVRLSVQKRPSTCMGVHLAHTDAHVRVCACVPLNKCLVFYGVSPRGGRRQPTETNRRA